MVVHNYQFCHLPIIDWLLFYSDFAWGRKPHTSLMFPQLVWPLFPAITDNLVSYLFSQALASFSVGWIPSTYYAKLQWCSNSNHFPTEWKKENIRPIFKGGNQNHPSNYRGIAIMSCLAKLFSYLLNNGLQKWYYL